MHLMGTSQDNSTKLEERERERDKENQTQKMSPLNIWMMTAREMLFIHLTNCSKSLVCCHLR